MNAAAENMITKDEEGTFVVQIQHKRQAIWQGNVTWAEGSETSSFQSTLELLKLIDGTLNLMDEARMSSPREDVPDSA